MLRLGARELERGEHRGIGFGRELLGRRVGFSRRERALLGRGDLRTARRSAVASTES